MAHELSLTWEELKQILERLESASRAFDCEALIELLREAPLGYDQKQSLEDFVWCSSNGSGKPIGSDANAGDKVRVLY